MSRLLDNCFDVLRSEIPRAVRMSQAISINAVDHAFGGHDKETMTLPCRAVRAGVGAMTSAVGEPAAAVERGHDFLVHILDLHREFALRLCEIFEEPDDASTCNLPKLLEPTDGGPLGVSNWHGYDDNRLDWPQLRAL